MSRFPGVGDPGKTENRHRGEAGITCAGCESNPNLDFKSSFQTGIEASCFPWGKRTSWGELRHRRMYPASESGSLLTYRTGAELRSSHQLGRRCQPFTSYACRKRVSPTLSVLQHHRKTKSGVLIDQHDGSPFSYQEVGASAGDIPPRWRPGRTIVFMPGKGRSGHGAGQWRPFAGRQMFNIRWIHCTGRMLRYRSEPRLRFWWITSGIDLNACRIVIRRRRDGPISGSVFAYDTFLETCREWRGAIHSRRRRTEDEIWYDLLRLLRAAEDSGKTRDRSHGVQGNLRRLRSWPCCELQTPEHLNGDRPPRLRRRTVGV